MNLTNPLISIIVPCFNHGKYLSEALESVNKQTFKNWECIIVDDGSTDNSKNVAEEWLNKDSRFIYCFQESAGVSSARNIGISLARGNFLLPLDSDDKLGASYLELAAESFQKNAGLKLVYCKAKKFGTVNEDWILPPYNIKTLARGNIIFSSAFFKKEDWERIGGYDKNYVHGYEDWDFWISLLKNGGEVYQIPDVQFYYRIKNSSRNKDISEMEFEKIYKYISQKHCDFFINNVGSFQHLLRQIKYSKEELKNLRKREKRFNKNLIFKLLKKLGFFS